MVDNLRAGACTGNPISRRQYAAHPSSRSHRRLCTICSQQDPCMVTSPHITKYSMMTTRKWSAHAAESPDHIFYCRKVPPRYRMRMKLSPTAEANLSTGRSFENCIKLAKISVFFDLPSLLGEVGLGHTCVPSFLLISLILAFPHLLFVPFPSNS